MARIEEDREPAARPYARLGTGAALGALLGYLFETHGLLASKASMLDNARLLDVELGLVSGFSAAVALLWVEEMRRRFYPVATGAAFAASLQLAFVVCVSIGQEAVFMNRYSMIFTRMITPSLSPLREALIDGLLSAGLCGGAVVLVQVFIEPRLRRGVTRS